MKDKVSKWEKMSIKIKENRSFKNLNDIQDVHYISDSN